MVTFDFRFEVVPLLFLCCLGELLLGGFLYVLLAWERHDFRSLMTVNGDFEYLILDSVGGSFWSLVLYTTLSMNATPKPMNNT